MSTRSSLPAPTRDQSRRIVRWASRSGVAKAHAKGFGWFRTRLLRALDEFERTAKTRDDQRLLSGAYYVVGDIHDFNGAPRAAVAAYRKSLRFDKNEAAAWREIGSMLERMGLRPRARSALRRAVALDPNDGYAKTDLAYLGKDNAGALFREGDPVWEADELLARGRVDDAWTVARHTRGVRGLLCAARILGARGDDVAVLRVWDRILRSGAAVELSSGDWFFLPEVVFDAQAFWSALWKLRGRLQVSVFVSSDTLIHARSKASARRRTSNDGASLQRLMIRYNLARTREDARSLRALLHTYPTWREPRDCLKRLEALRSRSRQR
jgi:tetratricopeptide (TPR) repeat protein